MAAGPDRNGLWLVVFVDIGANSVPSAGQEEENDSNDAASSSSSSSDLFDADHADDHDADKDDDGASDDEF